VSAEEIAQGLAALSPEERREVQAKLREFAADAQALAAEAEGCPEAQAELVLASQALEGAGGSLKCAELDELRNARQDFQSTIDFSKHIIDRYRREDQKPYPIDQPQHRGKTMAQVQAERDYGSGATVEDAVRLKEDEICGCEQRLEEVAVAIFDLVAELWEETFPDSCSLFERRATCEGRVRPHPFADEEFDAEFEFKGKLWEEIFDRGLRWGSRGMIGLSTDVCVDMFEVLDVVGMHELVMALRREDNRKITSLLSRLSNHDRQKGYDVYNAIYTQRGSDGRLCMVIEQHANPLYVAMSHQRRRGPEWVAGRFQRGARQRASRGRVLRTRGSRRATSRSAGGGDDPDPEPLARTGAYGVGWARTQWDATMAGFGMTIGIGVLGVKGMVIGGLVGYFWGRHRWSGDN